MHHFVNQAYVNTSSIVAHRRYASALFCLMPLMNEGIDTHFHRRSFHRASYLVIDIRMSHHKSDGLPSDHSHKSFVIGGLGMFAQRVYFFTYKSSASIFKWQPISKTIAQRKVNASITRYKTIDVACVVCQF